MKDIFEDEISGIKDYGTTVPIDSEINSQKMRTFEQKYYFCTLKQTMKWR